MPISIFRQAWQLTPAALCTEIACACHKGHTCRARNHNRHCRRDNRRRYFFTIHINRIYRVSVFLPDTDRQWPHKRVSVREMSEFTRLRHNRRHRGCRQRGLPCTQCSHFRSGRSQKGVILHLPRRVISRRPLIRGHAKIYRPEAGIYGISPEDFRHLAQLILLRLSGITTTWYLQSPRVCVKLRETMNRNTVI